MTVRMFCLIPVEKMSRDGELKFQVDQSKLVEELKRSVGVILNGKLSESDQISRIRLEILNDGPPVGQVEELEPVEEMEPVILAKEAEEPHVICNWIHMRDCYKH